MHQLPQPLSPQDSLVAIMIAVSAADLELHTAELVAIQALVNHLPFFADYDSDRINTVAQTVFDLFEEEDGLDALFGLIRDALPD
ncbi:MAG: tellurite resistance TerB family protein, partial [Roseinatronobacter sp.]|nr:tellurite resistance TerB family protein [Roseinatronobacter sp.]